jgi:anti-anti-sigma regulatory factor
LLCTDGDPIDFDLSGVRFMDKSGWAATGAAADVVRRAGVDARVVNPSPAVRRLTELLLATHPSGGRNGPVPPLAPVA